MLRHEHEPPYSQNLRIDQCLDQNAGSEQEQQKPSQLQDQLCDELRRVAQEHFASMDRAIQSSVRRCLSSHVPSSSSHQARQMFPGRVDDDMVVTPGADSGQKEGQARNPVYAWADSQQAGLPSPLNEVSHGPPVPQARDSISNVPPMMSSTELALVEDDPEENQALDSLDSSKHDAPMPHKDSKRAAFEEVLPAEGIGTKRSSMNSSSLDRSSASVRRRSIVRKSNRKRDSSAQRQSARKSVFFGKKNEQENSGEGQSVRKSAPTDEMDGPESEQEHEDGKANRIFASISRLMTSRFSVLSKATTSKSARSVPAAHRASAFHSATKRLALQAQQNVFQRIVRSKFWAVFSFGLIILNSVLVGWQTQAMAERALQDIENGRDLRMEEPVGFTVAQILFTLFFSFELAMRWFAEGFSVFWRVDTSWNLLDFTVVVLGWTDVLMLVVTVGGQQQSNTLMTFRVMRVLRVIRIGRMGRAIKFFRELRMMIHSILASFKSLGWVVIILIIMFYMFGISFTAGVTDNLVSRNARQQAKNEAMVIYFGTLDRSILTLYMSMTGGEDWKVFHDSLETLPFFYKHIFIVFITFAILAVFNIVTGVFVESAMASSQQDREAVIQDEIEAKKHYTKAMEKLFLIMDEDDSGTITLEEFESRLDDERVAAYFNSLKLDVSDAKMLFQLLDHDGSNEIDYSEFVAGCQRLQGEASSLDAKIMQYEVKYLKTQMDYVIGFLEQLPQNAPLGGAPPEG